MVGIENMVITTTTACKSFGIIGKILFLKKINHTYPPKLSSDKNHSRPYGFATEPLIAMWLAYSAPLEIIFSNDIIIYFNLFIKDIIKRQWLIF